MDCWVVGSAHSNPGYVTSWQETAKIQELIGGAVLIRFRKILQGKRSQWFGEEVTGRTGFSDLALARLFDQNQNIQPWQIRELLKAAL